MLLGPILAAWASSPLEVLARTYDLAPLTVDQAPADGTPDGWSVEAAAGRISVSPEPRADGSVVARVDYTPGTQGRLCSPLVPMPPGETAVLSSQVSGDASLGDVTALHLHLIGAGGILHTAKRRLDKGAFPWEPVDIRATAPPGTSAAMVCLEVRMVAADRAGTFRLAPLRLQSITATSRAPLPIKRVVLISVETFRRDHVHAYGYPRRTTTSLDRMIAEGVSYDRHYAAAPYTHPSLASLVTGLMPTTLGFADNTPKGEIGARTAAEHFADAGYVTASFNVQYILSNRFGFNRGFHYYRNLPNDTPGYVLSAELLPWLDDHADDNTFTWVHWFDPHGPYRPPPGYREFFQNDALWLSDLMTLNFHPTASEGVAAVPKYVQDPGAYDRRHYVAGYDGDIAAFDAELGRLLDLIRARGWDKDTLVVVTADHGESMTDHNRYFCHGSLWEHDIHVPMVVWAPGRLPAGVRVGVPTSHVDVLPSLLAWAGVKVQGFIGDTMGDLLTRARAPGRIPFAVATLGKGASLRYALRDTSDLKVFVDAKGRVIDAYDLVADPAEGRSLAGLPPRAAQQIASTFRAWLATQKRAAKKPKEQAMDAEDLERLRQLGYVE